MWYVRTWYDGMVSKTLFCASEFFRSIERPSCAHVGVRRGVGGHCGRWGVILRSIGSILLSNAAGLGVGFDVGRPREPEPPDDAGDAVGDSKRRQSGESRRAPSRKSGSGGRLSISKSSARRRSDKVPAPLMEGNIAR